MGIKHIKLVDFGLAKQLDIEIGNMLTNTACGTPWYTPPEMIEERAYGTEADYWSIGVLAFILLSGEPPFTDTDCLSLFDSIRKMNYNFDAPIWKLVTPEGKDFISKLLVKD